ncbi:hypothetical protein H6F88_02040 [Oculatella sp. FACHB-28]|uniref:hypothetical protein n=1 Tax=Oculatella sp. FACHB-28 TaxID=2692845 RepID=UPI0016862919|nr:hypothetical protein [Oculatella sp. FACHB-28]MBD2054815.1 hypothetical protein [Oculatella sp. FACHB-28]
MEKLLEQVQAMGVSPKAVQFIAHHMLSEGEHLILEGGQLLIKSGDRSEPASQRYPDLADLLAPDTKKPIQAALQATLKGERLPPPEIVQPNVEAADPDAVKTALKKHLQMTRIKVTPSS